MRARQTENYCKTCGIFRDLLLAVGPPSLTLKENDVNHNHLSALRNKHADLEQKLEREEHRPFPDTSIILSLKKQKLHLKDVLMQESALTG